MLLPRRPPPPHSTFSTALDLQHRTRPSAPHQAAPEIRHDSRRRRHRGGAGLAGLTAAAELAGAGRTGPSSLWPDATGRRLPAALFPGFDTLGTLQHLRATGYDPSWFILTRKIIEKEFALSGSEQNPDLTGRSLRGVLARARGRAAAGAVA
jgi:predicted oxidoreductase